ncbi:GNAT family N-acetyltransferase [Rathayibacter sp. VKM Ac-2856]|uniref:GNAT family N-acetyltransferase n=1 Tax=unclassified Rathayibacter TaxID=2609250 RepID=UPI0015672CB6|nr:MULTISPECIES: GNAT family N-acetyltransferase [unclassified Rathayibacter]NQX03498.1 GNAT family N-acetyltransferase [Rathayibacter sp. VKM Ac-2858]NQX18666.1 GNAT family N-acetyltransferase [Rathayibacter sp. VKM Ac-2856]
MLARRDGDGWCVEVAAETRVREHVIAAPSLAELRRLVAEVTAPDVWLTVVGELDAELLDAVAGLDAVTSDERMMTIRLRDAVAPAALPAGVRIEAEGRVAHARIEADGEVAARGQVAVSGGDAVFDRIETTPRFRRRGLGGLVMTGLSAWAVENGASTGLLMASVSGRALYTRLGWTEAVPIVTLRGRARPC